MASKAVAASSSSRPSTNRSRRARKSRCGSYPSAASSASSPDGNAMPGHTPKLLESRIVDVDFGSGVKVVQPVNIYGCAIGDESFVGPFTEIQSKVKIGARCRIQSHTFVCELVTIGD